MYLPESQESQIDLRNYFRILVEYRWILVAICSLSVAAITTKSLLSAKVYAATTTIMPPMNFNKSTSGLPGQLSTNMSSLIGKAFQGQDISDMYVGILESRAVADAIIDQFTLMQVYDLDLRVMAHKKLSSRMSTDVAESGIVKVMVKDEDPNRAAEMANAFVKELDYRNKQLSSGQATSKREFLENRLTEIEEELSKVDSLKTREVQVKEMLFELLSREYELAKIEEAKSIPTIQVLDEAEVPEVRLPRGTKRKAVLAAILSSAISVFVIFIREYYSMMQKEGVRIPIDLDVMEEKIDLKGARMSTSTLRKKRHVESKSDISDNIHSM